jgi:hypothetical protein
MQISESASLVALQSEIDRLSKELELRNEHSKLVQLQLDEIHHECNSLKLFQVSA